MSRSPKTAPAGPILDKPAEQRIVEQATSLFTHGGVNVPIGTIAHFAHTNVATVLKYFGSRDRLVFDFIKSLMAQEELSWKEIEQEHPKDPAAQVRGWLSSAEAAADLSGQGSQALLARATVDLLRLDGKSHFLVHIERFWLAERDKIASLCERAKFRDPSGLADKLLLLVIGARNERNCYGFPGPSQKLVESGEDLMAAHASQTPQ